MSPNEETGLQLKRTPFVVAPAIILDLVQGRTKPAAEAQALFDAIADDVEQRIDTRVARDVTRDLLSLLKVVPLHGSDYAEANGMAWKYRFEDAIQFVSCRRIGATYLVTRNNFQTQRAPVLRRTAAEMLPVFRG